MELLLINMGNKTYQILLFIVTIQILGCAQPSLVNFDKYLDSSIGLTLGETSYDWRHSKLQMKRLISETENTFTYLYWEESQCSWEVDVVKATNVVLRWRYPSPKVEQVCHNLVGRSV